MIEGAFLHTCTVQARVEGADDAYGVPTLSWANEQENIACRFMQPRGKAETAIPGEEVLADLIVFLPSGTTVTEFTRRITTSESGFSGTYQIMKVRPVWGQFCIHHYECDLKLDPDSAAQGAVMRSGAQANANDGDTITHGYSSAPTKVLVTGSIPTEMVAVTAIGATTFTVSIKSNLGGAGTQQTVYWMAIP
jgi:hypothetical protein